jgi:hypothetical protein
MSVRPVYFNADGSVAVVYDELGHSGTIPAAEVFWLTNPTTGQDDHNYIVLDCPDGCGARSTHPVGGGADAPNVQEMFVRKVNLEGCACNVVVDTDPPPDAVAHVKDLVTAMDGAERWALDDTALLARLT